MAKQFFVTDNFASPAEWRELHQQFSAKLAEGMVEKGNMRDKFSLFTHYDAYAWLTEPVFTPNDLRRRVYSKAHMAMMAKLFNVKLTPEGAYEMHYHKPMGKAGSPHTDREPVQILHNPRQEEPCKGISFWHNYNPYRTKDHVVSDGCVGRRRIIGNIMYLTEDWQDGDGGETIFYEKQPDGTFKPDFIIDPLPNRVISFLTSPESWHASAQAIKERRTLVWWYHSERDPV